MSILELVKEWIGVVSLLLTGVVWWFVKLNADKIKANESAKQAVEQTQQDRLTTAEKDLDLDSRRVKASEEVASETLEHLAETREENLELLDDNYKLKKEVLSLSNRVKNLEETLEFLKNYVCFDESCTQRKQLQGFHKMRCIGNGKNT